MMIPEWKAQKDLQDWKAYESLHASPYTISRTIDLETQSYLNELFRLSEKENIVEMMEDQNLYKYRIYLEKDGSYQALLMKNIGKEKHQEDDWRVWNSSPFGENPIAKESNEIVFLNILARISNQLGFTKVYVPLKNGHSNLTFREGLYEEKER